MTGGESDYNVLDVFIKLVFTSDLIKKLFRGSGDSVI